jgi:undecaprenyl-diphosphatase
MSDDRRLRLRLALLACLAAVAVLTTAVARHRSGFRLERRVLQWLIERRGDLSVTVFRAVSHIGDPAVLLLIALVAGLLLARRLSPVAAAAPAAALLAASVTETVAKQVIGRSRPPVTAHLLTETDPSFPSGHTTGTAAILLAIALVASPLLATRAARIAAVASAGLIALLVGLARMFLGVHWLTDVVAGWFLGTAWAIGVVLVLPKVEERVLGSPKRLVDEPAPRSAAARTSSAGAR